MTSSLFWSRSVKSGAYVADLDAIGTASRRVSDARRATCAPTRRAPPSPDRRSRSRSATSRPSEPPRRCRTARRSPSRPRFGVSSQMKPLSAERARSRRPARRRDRRRPRGTRAGRTSTTSSESSSTISSPVCSSIGVAQLVVDVVVVARAPGRPCPASDPSSAISDSAPVPPRSAPALGGRRSQPVLPMSRRRSVCPARSSLLLADGSVLPVATPTPGWRGRCERGHWTGDS